MMWRFMRNVIQDAILVWPLIYFGLYLQMDYVYNLSLAFFWVNSALTFMAACAIISSDKFRIKKDGTPIKKRIWIHCKYHALTVIAELAAIYALGHFVLGTFMLISSLTLMAAYSKIEED